MIGIFDSGVGGLTVAKEIMKGLPGYDLIYFGDTARAPYGNKSKETIAKYALEDADFLIKKGAKILVIACNTASSLAYNELKGKYSDIPIFEVITPAVEAAALASKNRKIGVIGTRATIKSEIYNKKLQEIGNFEIMASACPLFVPLIEEGWLKTPETKMIARKYLSIFKNKKIDTLILGCTHYPIIKNIIQERIGRRVKLIDSASAVAQKVKEFLYNSDLELSKNKKANIYFSDLTEQVKKITHGLIGADLSVEQCSNETM